MILLISCIKMNILSLNQEKCGLVVLGISIGLIFSGYHNIVQTALYLYVFLLLQYKSFLVLESKLEYKAVLKSWISYAHFLILIKLGDIIFQFLPFSIAYHIGKLLACIYIFILNDDIEWYYNRFVIPSRKIISANNIDKILLQLKDPSFYSGILQMVARMGIKK